MKIVRAQETDAAAILKVIRACVQHLIAAGCDQWDNVYPNDATVADDIHNGSMYMAMDASLCTGVVALNERQSPEYQSVSWLTDTQRVLVVHRLAVRPEQQGHGVARLLMDFAEEFASANGYGSIRLDAYTGNPRAFRLYERRGYVRTGQVFFPRRTLPFFCYEKVLGASR
jgi:ribosomal protein S18 acetylase RimI-like enzyme